MSTQELKKYIEIGYKKHRASEATKEEYDRTAREARSVFIKEGRIADDPEENASGN